MVVSIDLVNSHLRAITSTTCEVRGAQARGQLRLLQRDASTLVLAGERFAQRRHFPILLGFTFVLRVA